MPAVVSSWFPHAPALFLEAGKVTHAPSISGSVLTSQRSRLQDTDTPCSVAEALEYQNTEAA